MRVILGILLFYARFGVSFSAIGFFARRLFWRNGSFDLSGKTILITGASGGIGAAVARDTAVAGANVIAVARNPEKLAQLQDSIATPIQTRVCDLSDTSAVRALAQSLIDDGESIDVLVNNVGVMLHEFSTNADGVDTQFATNLLNQYVLTEALQQNGLSSDAAVITVASGGMYMAPLVTAALASDDATAHDGTQAYAIQKRAQVVLTEHWQSQTDTTATFYVMHPGWVDTAGVKQSLPTFRKLLAPILRNATQGADTIVWLAASRPASTGDSIWLDRKARSVHAYGFTRTRSESAETLLGFLKKFL
ncbi:MAG: SDR family NAD(P)-dependent oxidoreductase [Pseudomonadota bacterium]